MSDTDDFAKFADNLDIHDITQIKDTEKIIERVLTGLEANFAADGWDQPAELMMMYCSRLAQDGPTGMLWVSDVSLPEGLQNRLPESLPVIAAALSVPDKRDEFAAKMLGTVDSSIVPLGLVFKFEAWGLKGPALQNEETWRAARNIDEHPDRIEARHVVAYLANGQVVHVCRERDHEPQTLPFGTRILTNGEDVYLTVISQGLVTYLASQAK